ncbi:MAG: hypothetical protein GEU88_17440, partial [Solirubrobacterales bacterium]|nr:hypothetical protein [Solirubrobacterales bacterium]
MGPRRADHRIQRLLAQADQRIRDRARAAAPGPIGATEPVPAVPEPAPAGAGRARPASARSRGSLSAAEARRLALAAQGFSDRRPKVEPGGWDLRRVLRRVGLLQIDSVNVLARAHYLPAFSRLGPYPRELLDRASMRAPRRLFEYWGHEASLLPVELQPLLRWRMERAASEAWGGMRRIGRERPELVASVLEQVRERGPIVAAELSEDRPRRSGPWWDWSDAKRALEWLFW